MAPRRSSCSRLWLRSWFIRTTNAAPVAGVVLAMVALSALASCSNDDVASPSTTVSATATSAQTATTIQSTTTSSPVAPIRVVTLNVLHGLFCDQTTDFCRAPDRLALIGQHLEAVDCPDLVGFQEIGPRQAELINAGAFKAVCGGAYTVAWPGEPGVDREMVLTKHPIVEQGLLDIANFPWEAYWVRIDTAHGFVDFLTTHFASSSNNPPCDSEKCPPVCAAGIETNECHAIELVDFFAKRATPAALSIIGGDLNANVGSATLTHLLDAKFVDTWIANGQPECDANNGPGCTGLDEAETPLIGMDAEVGLRGRERIDFVLVKPGADCQLRVVATAGFADRPAASPVNGMFWPSDHRGQSADLACA